MPLLTSTEYFTLLCCSISLSFSRSNLNLHVILNRAGEGATSPILSMFGSRTKMACSGHTGQAEGSEELEAGLMRCRGTGRDPRLAAYVCHAAVDGVLADP